MVANEPDPESKPTIIDNISSITTISTPAKASDKDGKEGVDSDSVRLAYKPPRFFRKSLVYNTWKLFGRQKTEKQRHKAARPMREKYEVTRCEVE